MSGKIRLKREKDSRWDMIRKKHFNCINVTTETVRKFLSMDFVDEKSLLRGSGKKRRLDPVIVMDLRHEMIKRRPKEDILSPKKISSAEVKCAPESGPLNKSSEISLIEKELEKFKSDIQRKLTPRKNLQKFTKKKKSILIKLNNAGIFESLAEASDKSQDFLETAKTAAEASCTEEELSKSESIVADAMEGLIPSVRFVDDIEVITYSRDETGLEDDDYEDDYEEEIESLIEDEAEFFGLDKNSKEEPKYLNYSKQTVTTTTYQQFTYSSKNGYFSISPNPSSSTLTDEAESTESSELNFYQMFNLKKEDDDKTAEEMDKAQSLEASLTIKSFANTESTPEVNDLESEDLVQEIIRVKAVANVENRHRVLRMYLMKWMHFTTIQKITKDSNLTSKSQRMTKIDAYLKKIREQKKKAKQEEKTDNAGKSKVNASRDNAIVMVKRYQSKLKLQQDIIEVQKLKMERQEKMIAELRLSRLSDEAKKFKQDLREELRNAMRTGDVRLQAKAKCLQVVGDVVEEQENRFVAYGNMIPKFLAKMQERAVERQLRHEQARDRRMILDQERDAQKQAVEDEKVGPALLIHLLQNNKNRVSSPEKSRRRSKKTTNVGVARKASPREVGEDSKGAGARKVPGERSTSECILQKLLATSLWNGPFEENGEEEALFGVGSD